MKGIETVRRKTYLMCGLLFALLLLSSSGTPTVYQNLEGFSTVYLYDDSLFIFYEDSKDTCAAAKVVMFDNNWAQLYSRSLLFRFKEGMSVISDTCEMDSCDIVFEFPNLDCDVLISFYFRPKPLEDDPELPVIPNEKDVMLWTGFYLRTVYLSKENNSCTFRIPRETFFFNLAIEALDVPPMSGEGEHYGLKQNPCIYTIFLYNLEDIDDFSTNGYNKRYILPKVNKQLFMMWFFNGDFAQINRECIRWKGWTWWNIEDEDD